MDGTESPPRGDRDAPHRTRRGLLRSAGAVVGTCCVPTVASAKRPGKSKNRNRRRGGDGSHRGGGNRRRDRDHRDPYERSLFLRERASWSNAKWRAYLSKRGIRHGTMKREYAVPRGDISDGKGEDENADGQVTTQKFDRYELTLFVTYSRPWYVGYDVVDVEWEFTEQEFDDFPQSPADSVAVSFRPEHYAPTNARDDWVYYGENCGDPRNVDSKTPGGAVCAWRDVRDRDDRSHFGVYVEPNWESYDEWERRVYVDFVHTWSGHGLTGVSVGLGGLSMSFTEDTDRWDVEDSAAEARLIDGERVTR